MFMFKINRLRFIVSYALAATLGVAMGYYFSQRTQASYEVALLDSAYDDRALAVISDLQSSRMILEALDKDDTATVKSIAAQNILTNITYVKINSRIEKSRFGTDVREAIGKSEPVARRFMK
jgi:hypothetical protein